MAEKKVPSSKKSVKPRKQSLKDQITDCVGEIKKRRAQQSFNPELMLNVFEELGKSDPETGRFRTLSEVLRLPGMPSRATFYRWLDSDESGELRKEYAFIMQSNYDEMHDERIRIAYDASTDIVIKGDGTPDYNMFSVPRSKLIVNTLDWTLERLAPNQYGKYIQIDADVDASPEALEALAAMGEEKRKISAAKAREHASHVKEKLVEIEEK